MSTMLSQPTIMPLPTLVPQGRGAKILIADADEDYRQLYSDLLRSEGYHTFCAKDGAQALAVLHRERIDIALVDVMIPKLHGISVCRELKNNPETQQVPIVLLTGWESEHSHEAGLESGADAYLKKPVNNTELVTRVRSLLEKKRFKEDLGDTVKVLINFSEIVEAKNPFTAGHGFRVSQTALRVANHLGFSSEEREWIRIGALLHDIGNVGVPDEILNKPGPLNAEEKIILNSHTYVGERICSPLTSFRPLLQIIRNHHERLDGSGYPDGLCGAQISPLTRVVAMADVYDGLTTERPYHPRFSHKQAVQRIQHEAQMGWWDQRIANALEEWGAPTQLPFVRCTVRDDA